MYNSKRSPAMIAHLTSPGCLSLIRSISAQSSSWGGGSTFGAPNLNLVISLAPLDRVLHTSSRSESQLNPTPTYSLDAADKDTRRYGYSPLGRTPLPGMQTHHPLPSHPFPTRLDSPHRFLSVGLGYCS